MKKLLFSMGVTALALSSCSQEEIVSVNTSNGDEPIAFRVRSSKLSRAQEFTSDNLQEFGVFALYGLPEDIYDNNESPMMKEFFNGAVTFKRGADGVFTSNEPYFYPTNGSIIYFSAFAPASLAETATIGNYGSVEIQNFTVDSNIEKQIDIICDNAPVSNDDATEAIELTFKHALSKVYVSEVRNSEDSDFKYEIVAVKFSNIHNTGDFIYRGEKALSATGDEVNPYTDEEGYTSDVTGNGIFWKPVGEQTDEIEYRFETPIVVGETTTSATVMSGSDADANGAFMLIPQQLSKEFLNEDGTIESTSFEEGMSYVAFLVRITHIKSGKIVYPYATGVEAISETIGEGEDAITYAWAAFPISSLWGGGAFTDYVVDFSKGAGYVAPGADEEYALYPILGNEIKFTGEVLTWEDGSWTTIDQENQLGIDVGGEEDPFGED